MGTEPRHRIAFDSVVLIDLLEKRPGRIEWIEPTAKDAEAGKVMIVLSTMAIGEVLRIAGVESHQQTALIDGYLDNEFIYIQNLDREVARIMRDVRRAHKINSADAVHVATALFTKASHLLTNDGDKDKQIRKVLALDGKLKHDGQILRILTPQAFYNEQQKKDLPLMNHVEAPVIPNQKDAPTPVATQLRPDGAAAEVGKDGK